MARRLSSTRSTPEEGPEKTLHKGRWGWFADVLQRPVSGASLAIFRMAVGVVMALEAWSLFQSSESTGGEVMLETYYTGEGIRFHLPYGIFEWLPLLP